MTWRSLHDLIAARDWQGATEKLARKRDRANKCDYAGCLPLHRACEGIAPPEFIRALIEASPSTIKNKNNSGDTPLDVVIKKYPLHPRPGDYHAIIEMLQLQSDEIEPPQPPWLPQPPQLLQQVQANNNTPGSVLLTAVIEGAGQYVGEEMAKIVFESL